MNRAELVEAVAGKAGLSKKAADEALSAVIETITKTLSKGGSVTLVGFGTFKVKKRKARTGINPQTGEKLKISARKVPAFTAGGALKAKVK
ncbi:MAG: DNA-binding protein [Armatimonadetes bacterium CG07_land_8_20_14_0_80_40_9]|nr:MAG: DNA-binding protein [Armatimonadetes bacterium CG07_land_8_20_14_0_80_40_9]